MARLQLHRSTPADSRSATPSLPKDSIASASDFEFHLLADKAVAPRSQREQSAAAEQSMLTSVALMLAKTLTDKP